MCVSVGVCVHLLLQIDCTKGLGRDCSPARSRCCRWTGIRRLPTAFLFHATGRNLVRTTHSLIFSFRNCRGVFSGAS